MFEQPHDPRETSGPGGVKTSADLLPDQCLDALGEPGRELAAALYLCEIASADGAFAKGTRQHISRRHSVLDRKIDPNTAYRRHGVGRVSNAEQAGAIPLPKAVDPYRQ